MKIRTPFLLLAWIAFLTLFIFSLDIQAASQNEDMPLNVTLRADWSGCDGDCDSKQSGNQVNSGSYTIRITGSVTLSGGSDQMAVYAPKNLTAQYTFQNTTTDISDKDCQKCNPVETLRGSGPVAFGKDANAIAGLQAFMGKVGAAYAFQLVGQLGPGYQNVLPSLEDRSILSFYATGPARWISQSVETCKACTRSSETINGGFAVSINVDMAGRKTGSMSWTSPEHPMSAPGAGVIDLGDCKFPKSDPKGKARYNVTWSLGEARPVGLKLKEVHFNYQGNEGMVVPLIRHTDEKEITAPEWTAAGERKSSAFIRNKPFKVKAVFAVEGDRIEKAEIRADEEIDGPQGEVKKGFEGLQKTMVEFAKGETQKEVEFTIRNPQAAIGVNEVRWCWVADIYYRGSDTVEVDMAIPRAGSDDSAGSEHTIYIVGDKPVAHTTAYEFAVKKGCQWAAGTPGGDAAFQAIWKSFWNIKCPEGLSCPAGTLSYDHGKTALDTGGLLRTGRGSCGAWQDFLVDVAGSQGIFVEPIKVVPKPEQNINTMIVWARPAQGNLQPQRNFLNHAIIKYNNRFYDPSYYFDLPVAADEELSLYENETFKAYCSDRNSMGTIINTALCMVKCSNAATDDEYYDCLIKECECRRNHPLECEVKAQ